MRAAPRMHRLIPQRDDIAAAIPEGPAQAIVSTGGDGGSVLVTFMELCLAGAMLSAYYLGWWLAHEPRPAEVLIVTGPVLLLAVGAYHLTTEHSARIAAGASGLAVALTSALGAGVLILANARRERRRARFARELEDLARRLQAAG